MHFDKEKFETFYQDPKQDTLNDLLGHERAMEVFDEAFIDGLSVKHETRQAFEKGIETCVTPSDVNENFLDDIIEDTIDEYEREIPAFITDSIIDIEYFESLDADGQEALVRTIDANGQFPVCGAIDFPDFRDRLRNVVSDEAWGAYNSFDPSTYETDPEKIIFGEQGFYAYINK